MADADHPEFFAELCDATAKRGSAEQMRAMLFRAAIVIRSLEARADSLEWDRYDLDERD